MKMTLSEKGCLRQNDKACVQRISFIENAIKDLQDAFRGLTAWDMPIEGIEALVVASSSPNNGGHAHCLTDSSNTIINITILEKKSG